MRIAMVAYGDLTHDSRVQREANALVRAGHAVTIFCTAGTPGEMKLLDSRVDVEVQAVGAGAVAPGTPSPFHSSRPASLVSRTWSRVAWLQGYASTLRRWGRSVAADPSRYDVWHAHDFAGLVAVAPVVGQRALLVYDVHDLFVETGSARQLPSVVRSLLLRYERHLVRGATLTVTVNQALADVIQRRCRPRSMIVIHNCPQRWDAPEPRPDRIREAAGIPSECAVILYHGLLSSNRGLGNLMKAMLDPRLENAHLALMGFGMRKAALEEEARDARFRGRVHVLDAVPPSDLLPWVASADVGAAAMPRASLNLYLSTPNKLFECLAAGTPVVVSDFPAVRDIVMGDPDGPLGASCNPSDVDDLARALAQVLHLDAAARQELRARCAKAAHERWNWETEAARLANAYKALDAAHSASGGTRASSVAAGD